MNIGSANTTIPQGGAAQMAAEMADRVRSAHRDAEIDGAQSEATSSASPSSAEPAGGERVDSVGAELRRELEAIVSDVVTTGASEPPDLVGTVISRVVEDRLEQSEFGSAQKAQQDQIADRMKSDPVVVAEIDELLCDIARDMALRQR